MTNKEKLEEMLRWLPKPDAEVLKDLPTERLNELKVAIDFELQKRSCKNEHCEFEKERFGKCECEGKKEN